MATNKRLDMLLKMTASPGADAFAFYALAMEYKSADRVSEALATFRDLRERFPEYLPMYLICGTMLVGQGERTEARRWLEAGIVIARQQGDKHARSEIEATLESIGDA